MPARHFTYPLKTFPDRKAREDNRAYDVPSSAWVITPKRWVKLKLSNVGQGMFGRELVSHNVVQVPFRHDGRVLRNRSAQCGHVNKFADTVIGRIVNGQRRVEQTGLEPEIHSNFREQFPV
jgi:hypothetical protein